MEAMCWLWVGVGKSARLTVQGIKTEWFERCDWAVRRGALRRADGGGAQAGGAGGKLAFQEAVASVRRDRDSRGHGRVGGGVSVGGARLAVRGRGAGRAPG